MRKMHVETGCVNAPLVPFAETLSILLNSFYRIDSRGEDGGLKKARGLNEAGKKSLFRFTGHKLDNSLYRNVSKFLLLVFSTSYLNLYFLKQCFPTWCQFHQHFTSGFFCKKKSASRSFL